MVISSETQIVVYNFESREEDYTINLKSKMTCINVSHDSRYMLINMAHGEVQLIEIDTAEIVRRFLGQQQGEYMIRSCFGGADQNLVISGSEGNRNFESSLAADMLTEFSRRSSLHMAQSKWNAHRMPRRSPKPWLCECCCLEPSAPMHVRFWWR